MKNLLILLCILSCLISCNNQKVDINDYNGTYYVSFAETSLETFHKSWLDREDYDYDGFKPVYLEDSYFDNPMAFTFDFENNIFIFGGSAYSIMDIKVDVSSEDWGGESEGDIICTITFHLKGEDALYEFVDMDSEGIRLLVTQKFGDNEYYTVWIYHAYCTYREAADFVPVFYE